MDYARIQAPSLFLMSEGEAPELKRQSLEIYTDFCQRGVDVTLREFTAPEGANGRCQVNNLRLAHWVIFDRLGRVFGNEPGEVRLRCSLNGVCRGTVTFQKWFEGRDGRDRRDRETNVNDAGCRRIRVGSLRRVDRRRAAAHLGRCFPE